MLLQRAGTLLEQSTQGCTEHLRAIDEFVNILVRKEVLAHKDKVCISAFLVCYLSTLPRNERCMFDSAILDSWQQVTCGLLAMQDVKLRNALCLCHVLRMHAPETPFSSKALEVDHAHLLLCIQARVILQ